jgi:cysteinyl-tRNA synthetase
LIYSVDALYQARQALERFYTALRWLPAVDYEKNTPFEKQFIAAMEDDFNTPVALAVLFDLAHHIQRVRDKDSHSAAAHGALLKYLGNVLGILQMGPDVFFQTGSGVEVDKIATLIMERQRARQNKNWAEADRIRDELEKMHVAIEDGPQGTTWKAIKD